ncbi:MAG: OB-fold nucleic acid binding domain-containing protein [Bacteroidota bacterium]
MRAGKIFFLIIILSVILINAHEVITSDKAKDFIGKVVTLKGEVSQITTTKSNTTFINIDGKYPDNKFTLVIFKDDAGKFTEVKTWEGKMIEVNGKVELYKEKPQIVLKDNKQIKIVDKED